MTPKQQHLSQIAATLTAGLLASSPPTPEEAVKTFWAVLKELEDTAPKRAPREPSKKRSMREMQADAEARRR